MSYTESRNVGARSPNLPMKFEAALRWMCIRCRAGPSGAIGMTAIRRVIRAVNAKSERRAVFTF